MGIHNSRTFLSIRTNMIWFKHVPIYRTDTKYCNDSRRWANFSSVLALFFQLISVAAWNGTSAWEIADATTKTAVVASIIASAMTTLLVLQMSFEWRTNFVRILICFLAISSQTIYMAIWTYNPSKTVNINRESKPEFLYGFGWAAFGNLIAVIIQLVIDWVGDGKHNEVDAGH